MASDQPGVPGPYGVDTSDIDNAERRLRERSGTAHKQSGLTARKILCISDDDDGGSKNDDGDDEDNVDEGVDQMIMVRVTQLVQALSARTQCSRLPRLLL